MKISNIWERIASCAENEEFESCLEIWVKEWLFIKKLPINLKPQQLNSTQLEAILSEYAHTYSPKLSSIEIQKIIQDYPFKLPLDLLETYQIGNGCFPIGLKENPQRDWNSFDNYFYFPYGSEMVLLPLEKSIEIYRSLVSTQQQYQTYFDPHWFPIAAYEDSYISVIGSEDIQQTSSLISFYDTDYHLQIEWPSLTNSLLAWLEIKEQNLKHYHEEDLLIITNICHKYGATNPESPYFF